jgi:hypothetical protein
MIDPTKIINRIKSDPELKKQFAQFFKMASRARNIDARDPGVRRVMRNSQIFYADNALITAMHEVIATCVKKLGPNFGSEKEVERLLWKCACFDASPDHDQQAASFIQSLVEHAQEEYTYVCANQLFRFHSKVHRVEVGPVEIIAVSDPVQDVFNGQVDPAWSLTLGREYAFSTASGIGIQIPSTCWKVFVHASQANVQ